MYRTGSSTRVSDEFFNPSSSTTPASSDTVQQPQQLPTYNPESYVANKEKNRVKSYANVVHFIPLLLLLCALILWLFSTPVDMSNKGNGARRGFRYL